MLELTTSHMISQIEKNLINLEVQGSSAGQYGANMLLEFTIIIYHQSYISLDML